MGQALGLLSLAFVAAGIPPAGSPTACLPPPAADAPKSAPSSWPQAPVVPAALHTRARHQRGDQTRAS
jgi:hypothetical protein